MVVADPPIKPTPVPTPKEPITPIKPSQAIKLGRLSYPTIINDRYFDYVGGACTVGAMMVGYGYEPNGAYVSEFFNYLTQREDLTEEQVFYIQGVPSKMDYESHTTSNRPADIEKKVIQELEAKGA